MDILLYTRVSRRTLQWYIFGLSRLTQIGPVFSLSRCAPVIRDSDPLYLRLGSPSAYTIA